MVLDLIEKGSFHLIIFGVDKRSSLPIDNKKKDVLIIGKGPIQGLEHALAAEKLYSINFIGNNKNLV